MMRCSKSFVDYLPKYPQIQSYLRTNKNKNKIEMIQRVEDLREDKIYKQKMNMIAIWIDI